MSHFSLSPNQHIRIRMRGEYIITRKVNDEAWEMENVTTREVSHLTESDLLRMYVDGEMVFTPATADSESLRPPTDPPQSTEVRYVLEQVDVLCSPLDVFVEDETSGVALGRPNLAVVIHRPTNAVLGVNVSLDGRAAALLGAIKHSIMPKSRIAQEFPELTKWECYGVPWMVVVDVRDQCSLAELERISLLLGIEVRYSPRNLITVGEKVFRRLNQMLSCECGENSEGDARGRITLRVLYELLIKYIANVYMQIPSQRMGASPANLWRDAKSKSAPILPASVAELKIAFGIPHKKVLRPAGIVLHGLIYTCERLQDLSRSQPPDSTLELPVVVDPDDIGCIRVLDPENNEYFEVPALDKGYAAGLSLRQHQTIPRRARIYGVPELISIDRGLEFTSDPADNTKLNFTRGGGTLGARATRVGLSEEEHQLIDLRLKYVLAVADLPAVKTVMEKAILKVWEQERMPDDPPCWTDVFRWKMRWFALAKEDIALLDRVGGKRNWKGYDEVVVNICARAIDQIYMCCERRTVTDVLDWARHKVQEEQKRLDEERASITEASSGAIILKLPTRRLITKMLAEIPEFDRYAARYGTIAATMRFRWVKMASPKRAEGSAPRKAS